MRGHENPPTLSQLVTCTICQPDGPYKKTKDTLEQLSGGKVVVTEHDPMEGQGRRPLPLLGRDLPTQGQKQRTYVTGGCGGVLSLAFKSPRAAEQYEKTIGLRFASSPQK